MSGSSVQPVTGLPPLPLPLISHIQREMAIIGRATQPFLLQAWEQGEDPRARIIAAAQECSLAGQWPLHAFLRPGDSIERVVRRAARVPRLAPLGQLRYPKDPTLRGSAQQAATALPGWATTRAIRYSALAQWLIVAAQQVFAEETAAMHAQFASYSPRAIEGPLPSVVWPPASDRPFVVQQLEDTAFALGTIGYEVFGRLEAATVQWRNLGESPRLVGIWHRILAAAPAPVRAAFLDRLGHESAEPGLSGLMARMVLEGLLALPPERLWAAFTPEMLLPLLASRAAILRAVAAERGVSAMAPRDGAAASGPGRRVSSRRGGSR